MTAPPRLPSSALATRRSRLLDDLGVVHGFFERSGGVSEGAFASLNTSLVVGDRDEHVHENLRRIREVLGVPEARLHAPTQVHGDRALTLDDTTVPSATACEPADALLSRAEGQALGVRTADCVPILLACRTSGWCGAVHAGWRGCAQNIAGKTVRRLFEAGARDLVAAVGPHISVDSFEVSEDVVTELLAHFPAEGVVVRGGVRPHVDLRRLVHLQLEEAGVDASRIDHVHGCTVLEPDSFFSHRRDRGVTGRMLSVVVVPGAR